MLPVLSPEPSMRVQSFLNIEAYPKWFFLWGKREAKGKLVLYGGFQK